MQPDAFDLMRGVRTLLAESLLPQATSPYLSAQIMLSIGMLDAAARELDNVAAARTDERLRVRTLALHTIMALSQDGIEDERTSALAAMALRPTDGRIDPSLKASAAADARLLGALDLLVALCDDHAPKSTRVAVLAGQVDAVLRAHVARRASWGVPGSP